MKINAVIHPKDATKNEGFAVVRLEDDAGARLDRLDIEFSRLAPLNNKSPVALDLLLLGASVYAIDKRVPRSAAPDSWTRDFELTLPVSDPNLWESAREHLTAALSFLSGDRWQLKFTRAGSSLLRGAPLRGKRLLPITGDVVSLFSGGLDSLVGVIDRLHAHPDEKLVLVGHHDGQMAGPLADQKGILEVLSTEYQGRLQRVLVRIGHGAPAEELTLRSRSLLFLATGIFAASALGAETPLLIPENGTIAVNVPLTPSRRGSCSTRTTHPYFFSELQKALRLLGFRNRFENPLQWKTKGEVVAQCADTATLQKAFQLSVSCAKRGHRKTWHDRKARSCGRCMPCIYRRAGLHSVGLDVERYGSDVCKGQVDLTDTGAQGPNDFRACLSFLKRAPTSRGVATMLLTNGKLELANIAACAALVERAMDEIRAWLRAKARKDILVAAGIRP